MKKRLILLLLALSLFICLPQSPVYAETWPVSWEELAAADLMDTGEYWYDDDYREPTEKWAQLWAQKNYGEDAVILSMQYVETEQSDGVNVGKLLDGYQWFKFETWELRLIPQTFSDDLELSDVAYTISVQVVFMEKKDGFEDKVYTLVGFLPPEKTFHDLFEVRTYLQEDPRFADSLAELRTIVPEGVTEIDLRTVLGDDVLNVGDAWMLSTNVYVIIRNLPEDRGYEIIVLDIQNGSILSRTPVPHAEHQFLPEQSWEDGVFYLEFTLYEDQSGDLSWFDPKYSYIKVSVLPDGTVDTGDFMQGRSTIMPGGKAAVREADDGSLYAVDLATGKEELLLQGISNRGTPNERYKQAQGYVPFWDEQGYDGVDEDGAPFPLYKNALYTNDDVNYFRKFYMYEPLDEHRFTYAVHGWEWGVGYGLYDLQTRTNHRIAGEGHLFGVGGDTVFGTLLKTDVSTYESSLLPESVQKQFEEYFQNHGDYTGGDVDYDISPGGKLLALTGMKSRYSDAHTVTLTDIQTGDIVKAYDIHNPFAIEYSVAFYDDTHFMLFCQPEEHGSAYIYLFNIEE